ncbi:auxin-responsive protein SAUR62-like [Magnolia sinica]|uniref:auxin-responsive protein SAUR62-like n=1 Tax=Magnolia sinica TaxID=86752 RepID=UPI002658242F|nr:auxin-responsive protein SAUR62-like [Magnolia sinica]
MINPKRLVALVRKWQKLAVIGRRRISMSRTDVTADSEACKKSKPNKGHFIIYTADGRRFAVPLAYHNSPIFQELFKMSEDKYGLPGNGPIKIPCHAVFMDHIVSLLQRKMAEDVERALLIPAASLCSSLKEMLSDFRSLIASFKGEFTLRAILNGHLDLSQAENVGKLISAKFVVVTNAALVGI